MLCNQVVINVSELKHGDVLLYEHKKYIGILPRLIRIIIGNKITHAGIIMEVDNRKFVLEQLTPRTHSYLPFYYALPGEVIHCARPKFMIPAIIQNSIFEREKYGNLAIIDCAINHFIGLFLGDKYKYKPILARLFKSERIICSALVAKILRLDLNTNWCNNYRVVEPDDFINHCEDFSYLGIINWNK